jgi:hypothetical protein
MVIITMTALPGHNEREPGHAYTMTVIEVMGTCLGRSRAEAKTVDQVRALVKTFGEGVAAQHPGQSFTVSVGVAKGSRKPAGFDAANWRNGLGEQTWMKTIDKADRGNSGLAA